jgi:hypothetical protein
MTKFHEEMLENSEVLKSRSIEILPEVDRSTKILQKCTRMPNQGLLHDKKQSSL